MTALKSLLFLIVAPGIVVGYIPLALLRNGIKIETGIFFFFAIPLWIFGGAMLLWCFWDFFAKGKGTPAPLDPPKKLVATGFYRYIRNPMYVALILILLGHFLWFKTIFLLAYIFAVFLAVHLFVMLYEEPTLRKKFGAAYEEYLQKVPRWIPRFGKSH